MILNPKYGRIGMFSLPFFFFLEFVGPIIETIGYVYIITLLFSRPLGYGFTVSFLVLAILWGVMLSMLAVLFEDLNFTWYKKWYYIVTLGFFAVLENISYHQLTVVWRIQGLIDYMRGKKGWGSIERRGFLKHQICDYDKPAPRQAV